MRVRLGKRITGCVLTLVILARIAAGQTPAPDVSNVVTNPTYISISVETIVNRSASETWKHVGKFCDISQSWPVQLPCSIISGKDGELGAVRSAAGEVLVGKTEFSYTYTQTVKPNRPYNLYHGTVEARPVTADTCRLIYSVIYDNSMFEDDTAREKEKTQRTATLTEALERMKILAEGGIPQPPRPRPVGH